MDNQNTQNLPADILKAIESSDVYTHLESIGDRYNLLIDQIGQLNADTEKLMVGKLKSEIFVITIAKDLEISQEIAQKISDDINNEIFTGLRESLRKMQEQSEKKFTNPLTPPPPPTFQIPKPVPLTPTTPIPKPPITQPPQKINISSIEKVGNFTIEKRPLSNSPQYKDTNLKREDVLRDMENPTTKSGVSFVDHLLSKPLSNEMQTETKNKTAPPQGLPEYTADPYREPI
ncbi:MAG TPA: hypothetical protein VJJ28_00370 [Candidatus Paceibacterota bacterium]